MWFTVFEVSGALGRTADFYFGSIKGAKSANWYFFDINKL
jgi:hypothetical protein